MRRVSKACVCLRKDLFGGRLCRNKSASISHPISEGCLAVHASVIRLRMETLHLSILRDKSKPLAPVLPKNGSRFEERISLFCEFAMWVGNYNNGTNPMSVALLKELS